MLNERAAGPELMDDLTLANDALRQNLDELETINTWLGGYAPVLNALQRLKSRFPAARPLRLADLGSGGGDTLRHVARWARKNGVSLELIGIDANQFMLEYATAKSREYPEISYRQLDIFAPEFQAQPYDVLTCSLFCHHFTDEELVTLLRQWQQQAGVAVVINDLHRHWLAYHSIKWLTRLLGGSYLVRHDAPLSVARAFRRQDWVALLARAGITQYELRWRWAFRWQVIISG
ncbi:methyltransferase domain-containing protein [Microvirga sp. STS02]|uniref:methyltransferase domain-containing protein n=1 Tax=Hymenobacter negativus TaxID=2795026 RepID=UPI0018DDF155|nr:MULTISPECIES: methyltransferase domain-containing protein [Bacteria]MBH8568532.1 methyltransferase domain-containing protein [Hymenobacter negativus]MBR7208266.1 methyltransferase domain-containing protein [Microvirga sp. STS02]